MILDGHMHISGRTSDRIDFIERLQRAGVDGGIIISFAPQAFRSALDSGSTTSRLDELFSWCKAGPDFYPFYWVDPLEKDAIEQIEQAVERGVTGFKMICDRYYISDERAMAVCRNIAKYKRPILFHSGILWDGKPSSMYNRPMEFEALLTIDGMRFCLAHISWPWCDELIAVYGKFQHARKANPDLRTEMFVDITPGTPPIYREEALSKLFKTGYDVSNNILFGTDNSVEDYDVDWAAKWIERDNTIFQKLGLPREAIDDVYANNLKRFLGLTD